MNPELRTTDLLVLVVYMASVFGLDETTLRRNVKREFALAIGLDSRVLKQLRKERKQLLLTTDDILQLVNVAFDAGIIGRFPEIGLVRHQQHGRLYTQFLVRFENGKCFSKSADIFQNQRGLVRKIMREQINVYDIR